MSPLEQLVKSLRQGEDCLVEMLDGCDQVTREIEAARSRVRSQLAEENPETQRLVATEVSALESNLDLYLRVIESLAGYRQDFDKQRLSEALDHISNCRERLHLDFHRFREAVLTQRGPTTHPGLNLLYALGASGRQAGDAALLEALPAEELRAEGWLNHDPGDSPFFQELGDFYEAYAQLLQAVVAGFDRQAWLEDILALGQDYARLDLETFRRRFGDGPCPYPWINLLVHGSWMVGQDCLSPALVSDLLFDADQELTRIREALEEPLLSQAGSLLEELADWVVGLDEWLQTADLTTHPACSEPGLTLGHQLYGLVQNLSLPEAARCSVCGNRIMGPRCLGCGSKSQVVSTNHEARPENRVDQVVRQAEEILRGGDDDGFRSTLELLTQDLTKARAQDPGAKVGSAAALLRERYVQALDDFENGLAELDDFLQGPDRELLQVAEQNLRKALEDLQQLQQDLVSAHRP